MGKYAIIWQIIKNHQNSPGLAQGVTDHCLFDLESGMEQRLLQWKWNGATTSAIVVVFAVELFNYLTSLWREGVLSWSPWAQPSSLVYSMGDPFFLSVFLHTLFHNKITFVSKLAPKMIPKSTPNLTLDPWFSGNPVLERPYIVFTTF